jgi:sugar O-acyltransferase (sialic acid O-acetyltransferase NeuD family)
MGLNDAYEAFPSALMIGGIGNPATRESVMLKAKSVGFDFGTLVHPDVKMSDFIEIGTGTVICAGNIITTNIKLGEHCQINLDCTIGHDVVMGDYTTLAPGVHVSGWVHTGKRVYIGTGAVIVNGTSENPLHIVDDAIIGAGAVVTKSLEEPDVYVGSPARPIQKKTNDK